MQFQSIQHAYVYIGAYKSIILHTILHLVFSSSGKDASFVYIYTRA